MKTRFLIIIGIIMMSTIPFATFAALERYENYLEQLDYERQRIENEPKPGERSYIEPELKAKLEGVELDLREKVKQLHKDLPPSSYAVNLNLQTKEIEAVIENKQLIPIIKEFTKKYPEDITIIVEYGKFTLDGFSHCGENYLEVGNGECELNPEFIEPDTVIIYDVYEKDRMRLSIAPHTMLVNMTGNDVVVFENDSSNTVNIFVSDGVTPMPIFGDNAKGILIFEGIKPSSQMTLEINSTGYYQFLVQNSREGEIGEIVALSENTNSLSVELRAKMAHAIVSSDFRKDVGLLSVGSGSAEPGITIGIHEKFEDEPNAEQFYYEKYKNMIPFDVPIVIEFHSPATFAAGN